MGLKTFSAVLKFLILFFGHCEVGAKWIGGEQGHRSARKTLKGPVAQGLRIPLGERSGLPRGRVKCAMLQHALLLWHLDV